MHVSHFICFISKLCISLHCFFVFIQTRWEIVTVALLILRALCKYWKWAIRMSGACLIWILLLFCALAYTSMSFHFNTLLVILLYPSKAFHICPVYNYLYVMEFLNNKAFHVVMSNLQVFLMWWNFSITKYPNARYVCLFDLQTCSCLEQTNKDFVISNNIEDKNRF